MIVETFTSAEYTIIEAGMRIHKSFQERINYYWKERNMELHSFNTIHCMEGVVNVITIIAVFKPK